MPSSSSQLILDILKKYWGYENFRPLQHDIIESVLAGNDTLGLMPTGGGKSITFQVPTLATDGMALVVSPIIALMKDQVDNLRSRNIKAAYCMRVCRGLRYGTPTRSVSTAITSFSMSLPSVCNLNRF